MPRADTGVGPAELVLAFDFLFYFLLHLVLVYDFVSVCLVLVRPFWSLLRENKPNYPS